MSRSRTLLTLGTALSVLMLAASAQAGTKMFVSANLVVEAFQNSTTDGSAYPFSVNVFLGIPFGQFCNPSYGPGTTDCGGEDANAQAGKPLVGYGSASVTPHTTNTLLPAKFTLPPSLMARKLGSWPTLWSHGTTSKDPKKPLNGTAGGSFSAYFPYIYSYEYADLKNRAGNFFSNGGAGNFTYNYKRGQQQVGTVVVKAGGNSFGGTMALLGFERNFGAYSRNGGLSVGTGDWLFDVMGNAPNTMIGDPAVPAFKTQTTVTLGHTVLNQTSMSVIVANAWKWTTGTATVATLVRGPFASNQFRKGYDNRTANGEGTIQMVSPLMTHWLTGQPSFQYATGGIGILTLTFVPEPTKALMLGAGLSLMALLYRAGRRRS